MEGFQPYEILPLALVVGAVNAAGGRDLETTIATEVAFIDSDTIEVVAQVVRKGAGKTLDCPMSGQITTRTLAWKRRSLKNTALQGAPRQAAHVVSFSQTETPMVANAMDTRRSLRATLFLGIGLMAAVDEILFHQILAWHHFFDRSTPAIGILSDGLLHAAELLLLAAGFYLFVLLSRAGALARLHAWAGLFIGAGGFQLFDGIVNHKLLQLHQVRYVDNLWVYDLAWNGFSLVLLLIGVLLWRRARAAEQ